MTRLRNSPRLRRAALLAVIAVEMLVAVTSAWMAVAARGRVVDASAIPDDAPRTMIVLGAKVSDGDAGVYLRARLDVAVAAYREGRVDRILASGNDDEDAGHEVRVMRDHLQQRGVPAHAIIDDGLGLNTNATCRRARTLFDIESAMIVTQNFHVARAVTLCRAWGIDVIGVIAPCEQCSVLSLLRNQLREALASRPRAVIDSVRAG